VPAGRNVYRLNCFSNNSTAPWSLVVLQALDWTGLIECVVFSVIDRTPRCRRSSVYISDSKKICLQQLDGCAPDKQYPKVIHDRGYAHSLKSREPNSWPNLRNKFFKALNYKKCLIAQGEREFIQVLHLDPIVIHSLMYLILKFSWVYFLHIHEWVQLYVMTVPAKSVRATGNHQANIIVAYSSKIVSMLSTTCFVLVYAECEGNAIHDISLVVGRMFPYNSAMFISVESNWGLISVEVRIL